MLIEGIGNISVFSTYPISEFTFQHFYEQTAQKKPKWLCTYTHTPTASRKLVKWTVFDSRNIGFMKLNYNLICILNRCNNRCDFAVSNSTINSD